MSKTNKPNYWDTFVTDFCDYCGAERQVQRRCCRVPAPGRAGRSFCDKTCKNRWVSAYCHHPETLGMLHTKCCYCEKPNPKSPFEKIEDGYVFCDDTCKTIYFERRRKRSPEERFWSFIDKNPPYKGPQGDCWGWTGGTDSGYGKISVKNKNLGAHIFSYFLHTGYHPDYKGKQEVIMHSCDNPPCCNPEHLSLGTLADNIADKVAKGRQAKGNKNGKSKVTEDQVFLMRLVHSAFPSLYSQEKLGEIFNMSAINVATVLQGTKTWSHVPHISKEEISNLLFLKSKKSRWDYLDEKINSGLIG